MASDELRIGPFVFSFVPDGDDPGVGAVVLDAGDGVRSETPYGVVRDAWDEFFVEGSR